MKSMLTITVCMMLCVGAPLAASANIHPHRHATTRMPQAHRPHRAAHAVRHRRHRASARRGHSTGQARRHAAVSPRAIAPLAMTSDWYEVFLFTPGSSRDELHAHPPERVDFGVLRRNLANRGVMLSTVNAGPQMAPWPFGTVPLRQGLWAQAHPAVESGSTLFVSAPTYFGLRY